MSKWIWQYACVVTAAVFLTGCGTLRSLTGGPREYVLGYIQRGDQVLTLVGERRRTLQIGDPLPDVLLTDMNMSPVHLTDWRGKVMVISTVPSLDTPVCRKQTRHFNEVIGSMGPDVVLVTISNDLPFAQKRFCATEGIDNSVVLSDYRGHRFAKTAGLYIRELDLLTRAVLVVDRNGIVRYVQVAPDLGSELDYPPVEDVVRALLQEQPAGE